MSEQEATAITGINEGPAEGVTWGGKEESEYKKKVRGNG